MRLPVLALVFLLATALGPAAEAQTTVRPDAFPNSPHLSWVLARITLGMSLDTARAELRRDGWVAQPSRRLPDGPEELVQAWPANDPCTPAGTWLVCPTINMFVLRDPDLGPRLVRIEAFEPAYGRFHLSRVADQATALLGPAPIRDGVTDRRRGHDLTIARFVWEAVPPRGTRVELQVVIAPPTGTGPEPGDPDPVVEGVGITRSNAALRAQILAARDAESCRLAPTLCPPVATAPGGAAPQSAPR